MPISTYPNGFSNGVAIQNVPVDIKQGALAKTFWVDSVHGSDGNKGNLHYPFATIAYAVTQCTTDNGDTIYVASGHEELVSGAAGLLINIAGITISFLGNGADAASITFQAVVGASMSITAANVTLINPSFYSGIDALTGPISIAGADCKIINGQWYDAPAMAATTCVIVLSTATRFTVDGWTYHESTTGTQKQSNIRFSSVTQPVLRNINIDGDFSTANIFNSTACSNALLENIVLKNKNATPAPGIALQPTASGIAKNIDIRIVSGTTYVSNLAQFNWDNNALGYNADGYGGDPIGTSTPGSLEGDVLAIKAVTDLLPDGGALSTIAGEVEKIDSATLAVSPTAGSLARYIASGGTALGTPLAASKSLIDALGTNGTTVSDSAVTVLGAVGANNADNAFASDLVVADANGSVLERQEYTQSQVDKLDAVTLAVAPIAGSLARFIASGGTSLGTQLSASKSIVDAIGSDGTTLSYAAGSSLGAIGTEFWVSKTVVSNTILAVSASDLTTVSTGTLHLSQIILMTDSTGLAGGTAIEISNNNVFGAAVMVAEIVASLGANVTLDTFTVADVSSILESGKKVKIKSTITPCTGVGQIQVHMKFQRLTAGATISAA